MSFMGAVPWSAVRVADRHYIPIPTNVLNDCGASGSPIMMMSSNLHTYMCRMFSMLGLT
jgi:hypothetical protein